MKKLFWALCIIGCGLFFNNDLQAASKKINNPVEFGKIKSSPGRPLTTHYDNIPSDYDGFANYIKERAQKATVTPMSVVESNSNMGIVNSNEYIASQANTGKSTFQKIYEEALNKVSMGEYSQPSDLINDNSFGNNDNMQPRSGQLQSELALQNTVNRPQQPDFDIIDVTLPNGEVIKAPAKEHIPYLSSKIEIMPNGLVRIRETVTVVANGEKLKYGLSKALPKFSTSRQKVRHRTIPYLNSVKINGTNVDYTLKERSDRFLITPQKQFPLQSGIYTYEFDYILDRKLWYYDEFNEFYWDVTGSFWNLAITYAIATVRLPINVFPIGQNVLLGQLPDRITEEGTIITLNRKTNSLGFASEVPLFAGEGMHILIRIPKTGFIEPDFGKQFKWFMEDYGDILFALIGLISIFIAYLISWKNIEHSASDSAKIQYQRTPALYRMLAKGIYDKKSFGGFLLDIYKKGFINIVKNENQISLVKRTNNLSGLNSYQRRAIKKIFDKKQSELPINKEATPLLRQAYRIIEKDTQKRLKWLLLKLNAGYIIFSCAMILLAELAMAYLNVDMWQTLGMLVSTTVVCAFYAMVFKLLPERRWLKIIMRIFAVLIIGISLLIMSSRIHIVSALLILAMIYTIFTYSRLFAKRDGLIRYNVTEAQNLMNKLSSNAEQIIKSYQFSAQQANIFALEADKAYPQNPQIAQVYKLDIIPDILQFL